MYIEAYPLCSDDIHPAINYLKKTNSGNYGIFLIVLIMGTSGFISPTVLNLKRFMFRWLV